MSTLFQPQAEQPQCADPDCQVSRDCPLYLPAQSLIRKTLSDASAIKPCPFCGAPPDVRERAGTDKGTYICIISCMCGGYSSCARQDGVALTPKYARAKARSAWNRRAPLAEAQP